MKARSVLGILVILIFACLSSFADVVILHDGSRYDGEVIYQDNEVVIMKMQRVAIKINREDVLWIARQPGSTPEQVRGMELNQAVEQLTAALTKQLVAHKHQSVVIAPFWGPAEQVPPLNDKIGSSIAQGLGAANYKTVDPQALEKVLSALQISRSTLKDNLLAGRITSILGANSIVVGQITQVTPELVMVRVVLLEAETATLLGSESVEIIVNDEVRKLLLLNTPTPQVRTPQPAPTVQPVQSTRVMSGMTAKYTGKFSMAEFYRRDISGRKNAKADEDGIVWTFDSGNRAMVSRDGKVLITSTKRLTDPDQAKRLEAEMTSIFANLAAMDDSYTAGHIRKAVEFDSTYYGHDRKMFHRFTIRERDYLDRRQWRIAMSGNTCVYGKMALTINGSWAKLAVGRSYVVSFGAWAVRDITNAISGNDDTVDLSIVPYGWIKWYVGVIDIVTEPGNLPPIVEGPGSEAVEYKTNELVTSLPRTLMFH